MTQHHAPQPQVSAVPGSYQSIYNTNPIPSGAASSNVHQFAQPPTGPVFTQPVSQGHHVQAPSASQQHQTQMAYQHYAAQQQFTNQSHLFLSPMPPQNVAPAAHMYSNQFNIYPGAAQSIASPYLMSAGGVGTNSSNT
ncbi:hypothetical protein Ciccas_000404 [Cichlidogyrus casuarinus]|uniref:Uncharacterized protein n=1 Tax=Cichlidogyrus casuarinus TaxID=1844966 RepID=A0ABD2QN04_9PLAT